MFSLMDMASVKAIPLHAHFLIPNSSPISLVKIRAVFTRVCTCFSSIPYNFKPSINRRWLIRPFLFLISYPSFYLNTTEEWGPQQIAVEWKFCLRILTVWIYHTVAILLSLFPFSIDPYFFFQKLDHILCCFKHLQRLNVLSYQTVFYSPPTPEKKAENLRIVENVQALIAGENLSALSFFETKCKSVSCVDWCLLCCRWYWSCVLRDWPLYWQEVMGS